MVPKEEQEAPRSQRYTSRYSETVKAEANSKKSPGKLYGPKGGVKPDPKQYVKKGHGETIRPKKSVKKEVASPTVLVPKPEPRLPAEIQRKVPRHNETAKLAPRTTKDYVRSNFQETTSISPRKNTPKYIDKPGGTGGRHNIQPSYSSKPTYGKTPKYLTQRKQELQTARDQQQSAALESDETKSMQQISPQEHQDILNGLKANLDLVQKEYQGLSMVTDTISKKQRRKRLEAEIGQLEADISKLERYQQIFVDTG